MKLTKFVASIAVTSIIGLSAVSAFASEDDIKYRQAIFKSVGGHMTAMATILKTEAGDMKDIGTHADAMLALSKIAPTIFPEGSGPDAGKTGAKPNIWTDTEDFKKVLAAFQENAEKLAMAAKSGDKGQIGEALGGLGKDGCKACHDNFREKS
jgi:cytochrome c556